MKNYLSVVVIMFSTFQLQSQDLFEQDFYAPNLVIKYKEKIKLSEKQLQDIEALYKKAAKNFKVKKEQLHKETKELQRILKSSTVSDDKAIQGLEKVNALELEIKKLKLSALVKVKNALSEKQRMALDNYKDENRALIKSFDMSISDQGSQVILKLRGNGTDETQPLFILSGSKRELTQKEIENLDVDRIESISVLKGESAAEEYGKKGENGVIIITMKDSN